MTKQPKRRPKLVPLKDMTKDQLLKVIAEHKHLLICSQETVRQLKAQRAKEWK